MANFLLLYHGGKMPESPEEGAQVMKAWTGWFGELGGAVIDGGNPVSRSRTISPGGSVSDAASDVSGYSVIKADSLDAAIKLAKECPVLQGGASIEVCETFDAM